MVVKTVSGSVASWPATGNVTTRPLPVLDTIQTIIDNDTKEATIVWEPNPDSLQDEYKITYYELETYINNDNINNGDSSSIYVEDTFFSLSNLQPGRNYTISISAVSQGIESVERLINLAIDTEEIRQLKQEKATSKSTLCTGWAEANFRWVCGAK